MSWEALEGEDKGFVTEALRRDPAGPRTGRPLTP